MLKKSKKNCVQSLLSLQLRLAAVVFVEAQTWKDRWFFMEKLMLSLVFGGLLLTAGGCRSKNRPPAARPLPQEKLQINLNVDVEVAAPTPPPAAVGKSALKNKRPHGNPPGEKHRQQPEKPLKAVYESNPAARDRIQIPAPDGSLESELNSVERSYIRQIKQRHQRQVKASEDRVFGSLKPTNLMPRKQK